MFYAEGSPSGEILYSHDIPESTLPNYVSEGRTLIPASSEVVREIHYISEGAVVDRPVMGCSLSGSSLTLPSGVLTLSGVLVGATVILTNSSGQESSVTADGTDITISVDAPGIWSVRVLLWPYREEVFDFESVL